MAAEATDLTPDDGTAVLIVHDLGEPRPLQTLDDFTKTALGPLTSYHPLPTEIADTYEARRFATDSGHPRADFYEYDWHYLMTAGRFAGVMPTMLRLFLRRPRNVPDGLFGEWRLVWLVLFAALMVVPVLFAAGYAFNTDVPAWIIGAIISAVVLIFWFGLYRLAARALVNKTTAPLADTARYLDGAPSSYAARRAIRGGFIDLLRAVHGRGYSRIVVVGHGLGAHIAYDALGVFWAEANECSRQLPWRITDFVTIGAPLALADLIVTRPPLSSGLKQSDGTVRRELFDGLVRRGALYRCPTRPEDVAMPGESGPFAVTRWTNLWFPVTRGERGGDWFGGALGALFGPGIRDIAVQGNKPERLKPGSAHREYFRHADKGDEGDVAWHIQRVLAL